MIRARRLRIVAVGDAPVRVEVGTALAERLRTLVGLPVTLDKASFRRAGEGAQPLQSTEPPGGAGTGEPLQASSNDLVDMLIGDYPEKPGEWILGLTAHDLAAPGRSHVFGEATLGGQWAVVSTARLGAPGQPSPRLIERLCREALHEVGHLAGLEHCASAEGCVMSPAASVSAIDSRPPEFCSCCRATFVQKEG